MTKAEIEKMEAGPEMDALVAEKIFDPFSFGKTSSGEYYVKIMGSGIPKYSTDISAAWEVVEKHAFSVELFRSDLREWGANFYVAEYDFVCGGYCETAPLAICRAALLAVTGKEGKI